MEGLTTGAFGERDVQRRVGKPADPKLMAALLGLIQPGDSVLDIGAGTGRYVLALREAGRIANGVDGGCGVEEASFGLVRHAELTDPITMLPSADWAICIEVGEHVPEPLLPRFLDCICSVHASMLVISWAVPGQRGRNHVSCREPSWVVNEFTSRGWKLNDHHTNRARALSSPSGFSRKLLVFGRLIGEIAIEL